MTIEHRLQHAARELREVHVHVPPLGTARPTRERVRLQTLAAPMLVSMLFVVGGLFAFGATRTTVSEPVRNDVPTVPRSIDEPALGVPDDAATNVSAPSVLDELEMIAELTERQQTRTDSQPSTPDENPDVDEVVQAGPI